MTLFEIGILLHYAARPGDPEAIDAPIGPETCARMLADGLLRRADVAGLHSATFELTPRGYAYVDALQQVPLPVQRWVVEWPKEVQP